MSQAQEDYGDTMSEKQLMETIRQAAKLLGYLCYHTHNSMHSAGGFPDLVLVRKRRLIFAELKSAKGKITDGQESWLQALQWSVPGVEVYLWRPIDLDEALKILE